MAFERSKVPAPASGVKGGPVVYRRVLAALKSVGCGTCWKTLLDPVLRRDAPGPFDHRGEGLKRLAAGFDFIR